MIVKVPIFNLISMRVCGISAMTYASDLTDDPLMKYVLVFGAMFWSGMLIHDLWDWWAWYEGAKWR